MGENPLGWMVHLGGYLSKEQVGCSVQFSFRGGGSDKDYLKFF